jgi:eukaryotic-like serine/threonine-protein kinase
MSDDDEIVSDETVDGPGDEDANDDDFFPTAIARLNEALAGRYQIEGELGEGGMAIVYVADDLRHDRKVALKVLKPDLAAMVGADRFASEIKMTANLQHPNILPLFDSGEADGFLFYVMPYVKGETLQRRIDDDKQLPVDLAVRMITEVADGLDHAHRQGIVHRDIKPANILLRDGRPVIADFGIALAVGAAAGGRLTETGLSLGTPFYMSPEQATGDREVGPASDTFSLAAVLYEALTGDPPFMGGTAQAVLGKIVKGDIASARSMRRTIPINVDHAIQKALEKLPADRFAATGDFAKALRDPDFRHAPAITNNDPATSGRRGLPTRTGVSAAWWNPVTIGMTALSVALSLALGWVLSNRDDTRPTEAVHFTLDPTGDGAVFVGEGSPGVSKDGRLIAFPARVGDTTRIQVRDLGGFRARWLEGTDDGYAPFFSPDGEWIAYFTRQHVMKAPISGGRPTVVAAVPFVFGGSGVWLASDTMVFSGWSESGLWAVSANGGDMWPLTRPDTAIGEARHAVPRSLPDGRVFFQIRGRDAADLAWSGDHRPGIVDVSSGAVTRLDINGAPWAYLPSGHLLVWNSGSFLAHPLDLSRTSVSGPPVAVSSDLRGGDSCDYLRVSGSGTAVCSDVSNAQERTLTRMSPDGTSTPFGILSRPYRWPRLSPDGRYAAASGGERLFVLNPLTSEFDVLTDAAAGEPTWTPDSEHVVYWQTDAAGATNLWMRDRRAERPARPITNDATRRHWPTSVSPDGATVLFYDRSDLWTVGLDGENLRQFTQSADAWERGGQFSPNGRYIAYSTDITGRREVVLQSYPTGSRLRLVSVEGGRSPQWARDGARLYFVSGTRMMVVDVTYEPEMDISPPRQLFEGGFWVDPSGDQLFDVFPDGSFLAIDGDDVVKLRVVTGLGASLR